MESEMVTFDRKIIRDLMEKLDDAVLTLESIELSNDPEFMKSLKKSEEQIRNGDVVNFDDL